MTVAYNKLEEVAYEPGEPQPSTKGGEGMKGLAELGARDLGLGTGENEKTASFQIRRSAVPAPSPS